jgi:putative FmdB family regulatory protein
VPLYEYECRNCKALTDVRHGFGEAMKEACAACGGEMVRRFSPAGIVFKGSGFYKTDSRKSSDTGEGAPAKSDGASKADGAGKTDGVGKTDGGPKSSDAAQKGGGGTTESQTKKGEGAAA